MAMNIVEQDLPAALEETLSKTSLSMRDIFDLCKKANLPSVAQGMVEFPPPLKLRQIAAKNSMEETVHTYRDRMGEDVFRNGIRHLLIEQYGASASSISKDNILALCGVTAGCISTLMWLRTAQRKTRIGLYCPFYTYHLKEVETLFEKPPIYVRSNDDFSPNWDNIDKALDEGMEAIIVCNPANPHCRVWRKDELDRLIDTLKKRNCFLILDECYADMVWSPLQHYSPMPPHRHATEFDENLVIVRGFSKSLGCQSWRVGYLLAHKNLIAQIMPLHDPIYIGVPFLQHSLGEYLLAEAGRGGDFERHVGEVGALMQSNWARLAPAFHRALGWTPIQPEGTMYGMFKHNSEADIAAVKEGLKAGVGVCPGSIFWPNMPANTGYIRIHCGISEEKAKQIEKVLNDFADKKNKH